MTMFQPATRSQSKLRMALYGVSGGGKTYTALAVASALAEHGRVAVIDTERGSASKYAGLFNFSVLNLLPPFTPQRYIAAIRDAEQSGFDVLIIDSLSHAWNGTGGLLEMVDTEARKSNSQNTYFAWRDVTPKQNAMVDAILQSKMHVIVTMRSKAEYVIEEREGKDGRKKQTPRKVGLAPIQRDGLEYEFDIQGMMTGDNDLIIEKSRCSDLNGITIHQPSTELADILRAWLSDGAPLPVTPSLEEIIASEQPEHESEQPEHEGEQEAEAQAAMQSITEADKHTVSALFARLDAIQKQGIDARATTATVKDKTAYGQALRTYIQQVNAQLMIRNLPLIDETLKLNPSELEVVKGVSRLVAFDSNFTTIEAQTTLV
jgi:hypothetical protein